MNTAGTTTNASSAITVTATFGTLQTSIARLPANSTALRSPIEKLEPTTVWTSVVSADSRDSTSPVCVVSKNTGLCWSTRA